MPMTRPQTSSLLANYVPHIYIYIFWKVGAVHPPLGSFLLPKYSSLSVKNKSYLPNVTQNQTGNSLGTL
jgi:hypothetical protein